MKKTREREKMQVKVGDTVQLYERVRDFDTEKVTPGHTKMFRDQVTEVTITKVGTVYAYVGEGYGQRKFNRVTGEEAESWHERPAMIHTRESFELYLRRRAAREAVTEGTKAYSWYDRLTTEALEDIARILNNSEAYRDSPR